MGAGCSLIFIKWSVKYACLIYANCMIVCKMSLTVKSCIMYVLCVVKISTLVQVLNLIHHENCNVVEDVYITQLLYNYNVHLKKIIAFLEKMKFVLPIISISTLQKANQHLKQGGENNFGWLNYCAKMSARTSKFTFQELYFLIFWPPSSMWNHYVREVHHHICGGHNQAVIIMYVAVISCMWWLSSYMWWLSSCVWWLSPCMWWLSPCMWCLSSCMWCLSSCNMVAVLL